MGVAEGRGAKQGQYGHANGKHRREAMHRHVKAVSCTEGMLKAIEKNVSLPSAMHRDRRGHAAYRFFAANLPRTKYHLPLFPPTRKRPRSMRDTKERLERAAADAENTLAAEVDRVSDELRSKHMAALEEAVKVEREAAEARHVEVLRQAQASREQEAEQQVNIT